MRDPQAIQMGTGSRTHWITLLIVLLLLAGTHATWWAVERRDKEDREELLDRSRLVSQTINFEHLRSFSASRLDLQNNAWQRMRHQLYLTQNALPLGKRISIIQPGTSAEPQTLVDSVQPSLAGNPPGPVPAALQSGLAMVMESKLAFVTRIQTTANESWRAALIPLYDPSQSRMTSTIIPEDLERQDGSSSGNLLPEKADAPQGRYDAPLAILVVEVATDSPLRQAFSAGWPSMLLTCCLCLAIFTGNHLRKRAGRPLHGKLVLEPLTALLCGLAVTVHVSMTVYKQEKHFQEVAFRDLAASTTDHVAISLRAIRDFQLESLASFITHSDQVTPGEFEHFTGHLVRNPAVQTWAWVPVVPAQSKKNFEAMLGSPVRSAHPGPGRMLHPIAYLNHLGGPDLRGFDVGSDPEMVGILDEATASKLSTCLVLSDKHRAISPSLRGMLLCKAVYSTENGRLRGHVIALLHPPALIEHLHIDQIPPLALSVMNTDGRPEIIAANFDGTTASEQTGTLTRPLLAFGKVFLISAYAGPGFAHMHTSHMEKLAAASGLLLSLALSGLVLMMQRRNEVLSDLVAEKTRALAESNSWLQGLFENSPDAYLILKNGQVVECNNATLTMLHARREELAGKSMQDLSTSHYRLGVRTAGSMPVDAEGAPGQLTRFERQLRRGDGTEFWAEICMTGLFQAGEQVTLMTWRDLTERKAAEAALVHERNLFASGPVMTITWKPDDSWSIQFISENVSEILGYTAAEMSALDFCYTDIIHPDDRARVVAQVEHSLLAGAKQFEQSFRVRNKSGRYLWLYDFTKCLATDTPDQLDIRSYMFDQSSLKQAEENLDQERQRLANILEATNAGTWEWNIVTGEIMINARWAQLLGYSLEDLFPFYYAAWKALLHPDDQIRLGNALALHLAGESPYLEIETRIRHREGHWVWVLDRGKVITFSETGQPLMMFGTHQDVTVRKQTEEALRESEERYKVFFDSSEEIKLILEPESGLIIDANPAASLFYNYPEGLLGMPFVLLNLSIPPEVTAERRGGPGEREHFSQMHQTATGLMRDVDIYFSPITHLGRNLLMATMHDVTELKRLEQIKADVERITHHDLKSPLNGLINIPEILLDSDNLTLEQRELLHLVAASGKKMLVQINSSLEMHKIESGTYVFAPRECDIVALIRNNARIMLSSSGLPDEKIALVTEPEPLEELVIPTDDRLLDMVIMNLLRNALDANDPVLPVRVALETLGDQVIIRISNSKAVPENIRSTFFEKYVTAGKIGGTGLGTYSAALMTRALRGSIDMQTSDETGTTITLKLPAK